MTSFPLKVNVEKLTYVDASLIDDILSTAFEGGINYWCSGVEVDDFSGALYASEVPSNGGVITIMEDDPYDEPIPHRMSCNDVLRGIGLYCDAHNVLPEALEDDYDASDADEIVQYAIFGQIVYG